MTTEITIAYHLGAPYTDEDMLTWSLRKDAAELFRKGVIVRRPREYRDLLSKTLKKLDGEPARKAEQTEILRKMTRGHETNRVIFSNARFLGVPAWMFYTGVFYHNAAMKAEGLRNLFPENPCEFHIGISNPAVFIPRVFADQTQKTFENFMQGVSPLSVLWSDVISRMRMVCPDVPIFVWCNEDTPVIWGEVLRRVAGQEPGTRFAGETDILERILSDDGFAALKGFLAEHSDLTQAQLRHVMFEFLERHASADQVEEEIDLPGWTDELIGQMSVAYDIDLELIAGMDGVTLIEP